MRQIFRRGFREAENRNGRRGEKIPRILYEKVYRAELVYKTGISGGKEESKKNRGALKSIKNGFGRQKFAKIAIKIIKEIGEILEKQIYASGWCANQISEKKLA